MADNEKTTLEKLSDSTRRILRKYGDDVKGNLDLITQKMGSRGASALRSASAEKLNQRTGEYAKGWKHDFRQTRRTAKTTIFNEHYSLPHLLEHGHVTRNGTGRTFGRTPGHEHIAPVADQLEADFEREVLSKL